MATATIAGDTSDGTLRKYSTKSWAACQSATPTVLYDTSATFQVLKSYSAAPSWTIMRAYVRFDLSAYAGATINSATLNLFGAGASGTRNATVYYCDWGTALTADDWASAGTAASSSFSCTGWGWDGAISLTNLSSLLTSNGGLVIIMDNESTEPDTNNYAEIYTANESTESRRPSLDIDYTPAAAAKPHYYFAQL